MLMLLSSDYSPRYKQDVLRCLAAPINATVQFRYDRVHIAKKLLEKLSTMKFPAKGVVCSVASKGTGLLNLVPVRAVELTAVRVHGSTTSVALTIKNVLFTNSSSFTDDVAAASEQQTPRKSTEETSPTGSYFFEIDKLPSDVQEGDSLELWENTVTVLQQQHAYSDEPFFWTVLGVNDDKNSTEPLRLHQWPSKVSAGKGLNLLLYHYQPRKGPRPNSKLEVSAGPGLEIVVPPDTTVDSRYDLKQWAFRTTSGIQRARETWLRIHAADAWDLDLRTTIRGAYFSWIVRGLVTGALISIPGVAAVLPQKISESEKHSALLVAVAFGILAGLAASFKIERLD